MYQELAYYDKQPISSEVQSSLFQALDCGINGFSVPVYFLPQIHDIVPEGITLSCPIDYPNGMADVKVRHHATLSALRKGANAIDLVANTYIVLNDKLQDFENEIKTNLTVCQNHGATLRVMLEYRTFESKLTIALCSILKELGVEYVFPSTGNYVDNYIDNLLMAANIEKKSGLLTITNGNIWTYKHYQAAVKAKIFGVRFHSIAALKNVVEEKNASV